MNAHSTPSKIFTPSLQQQAVFDWVKNGRGNAFVEAVAGSGKTTTLIEVLKLTEGSVAFAAYNNAIAKEIQAKVAPLRFGNRVRVGTFHSFGFGAWRYVHKGVQAGPQAARDKADMTARELDIPQQLRGFVEKLVGLAKQRALGLYGSVSDASEWYDIIDHFDMAHEIEDESLISVGVELAIKALNYHKSVAHQIIDFDDMIYMPVISSIRMWQNDWLLGDEMQDANPARRALCRRMVGHRGRALFVGDRHQAIFGFCHPPGVKILTPDGYRNIETLNKDAAFISVNTSGDVVGWKGSYTIKNTTQHHGWGWLLQINAGNKSTKVTPHHRLPVKIDKSANYIVYMMERLGKFRVGFMSAYANAGQNEKRFMLSQRAKMEKADRAWILKAFDNKFDAIIEEAMLHKHGAFGGTMQGLTDDQVLSLAQERSFYVSILRNYGRLHEFPLWIKGRRQHFEANLPFITEACNIVNGMRVQVLGKWDERRRGRSRHTGDWVPVVTKEVSYDASLPTYGITVPCMSKREGYSPWPLYIADGIVVHNTGADNDSVDRLVKDFNCTQLPLTVTYRCPKSVVSLAQTVVSHIVAADEAPEGVVRTIQATDIAGQDLQPSDAILCRKTKPLVELAYTLIRKGVACHVEGKDIGVGLLKLVNKYSARTLDALKDKLEAFRDRECAKLVAKGRETQAENLADRVDTVFVMMDGCKTVRDLANKIASMFVDSEDEPRSTLTLATVHRSKGREWDRVFLLGANVYMPSKYARQQHQIDQEHNLIYVAYTRAKRELVLADVVE